ncbi:MAG TPA: MFS transporter [Burkholderiaceae bacterium]|nr:MFS transporter [Burkholderiaceae bacterium]
MLSLATRALVATTAIQAAAACALLTVPSIAPVVASELDVPASTIGTYISLLYVGASTAALAGGGVVLRYGALRLSQACLLGCAAGLLLTLAAGRGGSAIGLATIALGAIVLGIGYGPITPASSHVLAQTTSRENMALVFSIKQTGVPAGTALAGLLVPPLTVAFGWHSAIVVIAIGCLAIAWAAQPLRAPLDADRDRGARLSPAALVSGLAVVARSPALRTMALVSFVYAGMQMSVSGFIVAYLHTEIGLGLVAAGTALTVANVAGVIARISWGSFSDRTGAPRATLALIGFLMAGASVAAACFTSSWPMIALLTVAAALGATAIGWNGVYLSEVARLAPVGEAGKATGGCLFFTYVGVVVLPFLFGWLQRNSGSYAACFVATAIVCGAVATLLAWSGRRSPGRRE